MKDCEGEGGTKAAERTKAWRGGERKGDVAEERGGDTEPNRNKVWANMKQEEGSSHGGNTFTHLMSL